MNILLYKRISKIIVHLKKINNDEMMISKILEEAYKNKKVISITRRGFNWQDSIVGYVTEIIEDTIIINEISEYGKFIGNILIEINEICYIQLDSWHISGIEFILNNNLILDPESEVTVGRKNRELMTYLKRIKENDEITEIIFENNKSAIGKILEFNSEFLLIKTIGEDGLDDGTSCYKMSDIRELSYKGLIEQKIKLLFDFKNTSTF